MAMKPIVFSTPMVKAILEGRKTQTRRIPRNYDEIFTWHEDAASVGLPTGPNGSEIQSMQEIFQNHPPYDKGDILWVREAWINAHIVDENVPYGEFSRDGFEYKATYHSPSRFRWKSPIYMPRAAARIFLEVVSVRVERVQDISVDDCIAEGMDCDNDINNPDPATHESIKNWNLANAQSLYKELWNKINAKHGYSWNSNPWVWVYEFKRIQQGG